jgi:glycosyltransferase involved in cell wall biosynthesis
VKKIGVFVGDEGNWHFFREIFADLQHAFDVDVFAARDYRVPVLTGRVNRWASRRRMQSMLRSNDVCFFEWASELLCPASLLPKAGPIVTRLHSYELNVWAPRVNWDHVDRIVCVSEHIRRRFGERYPAHARKTSVVNNGVALERFVPGDGGSGALTIGTLGALHPVKRVYEMVLTMDELRSRGVDAHLHIGGGTVRGGYFDTYAIATRRLVETLSLGDRVTFHGHVEHPERWLRGIDIFVSNSYWEGQQVALLEALASGCYCLSHAWDGAEEVLPREQLYLTSAGLQDRIVAYGRRSAGARRDARRAARAIACERFDIEQTKRRIRDILAESARTA